jgi:glycosyltransferase involved in cell wall biosynthesis
MPHVLHIITGLATGGAETALFRLIVCSRDSSYSHTVISLTSGGVMHRRLQDAGIKVRILDFKRSPILHFFKLVALIRNTRPDIVQTWMYHANMLGGLAARLAGNPNIIWGLRTTGVPRNAHALALISRVCAGISRWVPNTIVCVAEAARRAHMAGGYDGGRMVVIPNGFELGALPAAMGRGSELRLQWGYGQDVTVIGTSGRFDLDKDHRNFVQAAALLADRYKHLRFLMVGSNLDANNKQLMGWIKDTGHVERFTLVGERSDALDCLAAMDIFCLSSRNEGFPNVIGEAMALGIPCVATDVGDAAVLVADTGVIVPKEDPEALAQGIAQLLESPPEVRRLLAKKARSRIQSEFSIQRTCRRFEDVYRLVTQK